MTKLARFGPAYSTSTDKPEFATDWFLEPERKSVILKRPWTRQPQSSAGVNWANPITHGLFFAWNAPARTDAVSNRGAAGVGVSLAASFKGLYGVGNGTGYAAFADAATAPSQITVFALWWPPVTDYQELFVFGIGKGFVQRNQFSLYPAVGNVYGDINGGSPGNRPYTAGINSAAFVVDSGVTNGSTFIVNNSASSASTVSLPALTGLQDIEVLRNVYAWGISPGGGVLLSMAWRRVLSTAELTSMHINPWQLFAPRRIIIPTSAAVSALPSITAVYADSITATSVVPRVSLTF